MRNQKFMKFLVAALLTALLSFAMALFFPWWVIAVVAFVVAALIPQKPLLAFLSAFLALFALWAVQSFIIDYKNEHILANKVAAIFQIGGSYITIILITAVIGALVAGFAALTGSFFRRPASRKLNNT